MRKMLDGSKMARGRKKRRMLRPMTPVKEATTPQTMRRRNLLTGGSGAVWTSGPAGGFVATAFETPALTAAVGVELVFDAPEAGATRAAGGVAEGKDLPGASPGGAGAGVVPEEARAADGVTGVFAAGFGGAFSPGAAASPRAAASSSETEGRAPPAFSSACVSPCSSLRVPDAPSAGGVGLSF